MSYFIPGNVIDLVQRDGLPRLVADEQQPSVQHVVYYDTTVRSMLATDWPPPLPSDPTPQQIAAALAARLAAEAQARTDAAALRTRVLNVAQTAVGVQLDALTAPQVRALLACLLHKAGAIDTAGAIKALGQWL